MRTFSPRRLAPVLLAAGLVACTGDDSGSVSLGPGADAKSCDNADDSVAFVMSAIDFARVEDGVSWGFDLDGYDSAAGDPDGCNKPDLTDPNGNTGIDNAFAGLLPALEATEAVAITGILQDSIAAGDLLLMMELRGVDDLENDDCVSMSFGPALGTPLIGNDGYMLDGQSFARDESEDQVLVENLEIVDGVVQMAGVEFTLELQVLAATFAITVSDASIQLHTTPAERYIDPSAVTSTDTGEPGEADLGDNIVYTGFFGGGFSIDYMLGVLNDNALDQGLKDLINQALPLSADLKNDDGECRNMSVTFEFESTSAYYFDEDEGE